MVRPVRAPHPILFASVFLFACSTAQYRDREGYDASCPTQIEYPCVTQPLGTRPGCEVDPARATGLVQQIPADASYPPGCAIILPVPVADDKGQCTIAGSCRCTSTEDAGANDGGSALEWICFRSHY